MGIRISKTMGWAFFSKKPFDYEAFESMKLKEINKENIPTVEFNLDTVVSEEDPLTDFIHIIEESHKKDLCLITPPLVAKNWRRYADSMDYQESLMNHSIDGSRKIKIIRDEVFPYAQPFVVSKTLKEIPHNLLFLINCEATLLLKEKEAELKELGLDLSQSLKKQIHMTPPLIVRRILEKIDPSIDYRTLRPVIVSYWS